MNPPANVLLPSLVEIKDWVKSNPWLFYLASRNNYREGLLKRAVDPSCDIVIEGFPRSANSFCVMAFQMAQKHPIRIANHCHTASQFILASKWNIPALLLIREPRAVTLSNLLYFPGSSANEVLRRYIRFHRSLLKLRSTIMVADFSDVTADFGKVMVALNRRFGTDFIPFNHTEASVGLVRQKLEVITEKWRQKRTAIGAMPSDLKTVAKASLQDHLKCAECELLLREAAELYSELHCAETG